jgi:2-polyprenyl-6-methoxyphenol hydroxylase-like FAD-dependent oxidoreductase
MRILVSGTGIAGSCLAFWLHRFGFQPTLVERAPALRRGGYVVDFWGPGFGVAERMGILPSLQARGYAIEEVRLVDAYGARVGGFSSKVFTRLANGRFTSVPRGDLASTLFEALDGRVDTMFGDSVTELSDVGPEVRVRFERAAPASFDLVIGADGLHSRVRQLTFGPEAKFEKYLGLKVAAFVAAGYGPRDKLVYVIHRDVGKQVGRFSMKGDKTLFLFVWSDEDASLPIELTDQKSLLRRIFGTSGWECPQILDALDTADELYVDRVSQIRLPRWCRGRVALVGDAAAAVSFLAGQGSSLAMAEAYVLAGELADAAGDHERAFARYERRLRDFLDVKQRAAPKLASFFAPPSRWALFAQNLVTKLLAIPGIAALTAGREIRESLPLPNYEATASASTLPVVPQRKANVLPLR